MKKITTHINEERGQDPLVEWHYEEKDDTLNMLSLLIEWANGEESGYRLVDAAMMGLEIKSSREEVFKGLSALSREMLTRMISAVGMKVPEDIDWRQTVSVDRLAYSGEGVFRLDTVPSIEGQNPMKGWGQLIALGAQIIRDSFRVFDDIRKGREGPMDATRLGICQAPGCNRFLISPRLGKRRSRACSKTHQAIITAQSLRSSEAYRERERERNARRMAAVREAEKIVTAWKREGKSPGEIQRLLLDWNKGNGGILGKKSLYSILEKGV